MLHLNVWMMVWLLAALWKPVQAAEGGKFRVGAARIDVTPSLQELPRPYGGVFQHVYVRVIVIDNGTSRAVLASVDAATLSEDFPDQLTGVIAKAAGVAPGQVLLAQTHAHDALRIGNLPDNTPLSISPAFNARVEAALAEGVRQSIAALRPARIGFGRGQSFINANRMQWDPSQLRYVVGADRTGLLPTDKSVYVIAFETLAGEPIALYANYALMPIAHLRDRRGEKSQQLGGDVPDATSLYLEQALGQNAVAIMTMGGEDQQPLYQIGEKEPDAYRRSETLTLAYGVMLGEEVLASYHGIQNKLEQGPIYTAATSATCPGKITNPKGIRGPCTDTPNLSLPRCQYHEEDTSPVTFRMNLLLLGNVAIDGFWEIIDATLIQRLQAASPYANTFVVSQFMGPAGYLIHDEGYERVTFDSINTRLKQGCAERAAIKGLQDMLPK
jgi:hypothetical protein